MAAIALLSACSTEAAENAGRESTSEEQGHADAAQERLEQIYNGTYEEPPTDGPAAQTGKKVFMVNVATQYPTGSAVAAAAKDAATVLGWDLTVFDGKYQPNLYQEGIRQAIGVNADVIWLFAIDCPLARTALEEAADAKIPVVAFEAADCSDVDADAPSLFADNLEYVDGSFVDWGRAMGAAQAAWIIAKTDGQAKVIEIAQADLVITEALHEGFVAEMATCDTCEILQTVQTSGVLGPELQAKVEQVLLRNPEANAFAAPYDDLMTGGAAAAIRSSGRSDSLEVIGGTGFPANTKLIRDDQGQDAGYGIDYPYETWAAADLVNRFLAGEPGVPSGIGVQVYDREHNMPNETYSASVDDFRAAYTTLWTDAE